MAHDITMEPVRSARDLSEFVKLPFRLYRNDPLWIPQIIAHEKAQFDPKRNPAFETARAQLFRAVRDGRTVGRVAAIVSDAFIERWGRKCGRFGWFECENDPEIARLLLSAAEEWVAGQGMTEISGPLGFTDNDATGLLIEGFDELPPIAGTYNPPWYRGFLEGLGYSKEVDYVEYRITVPQELSERVLKLAEHIAKRTGIRVFSPESRKVLARVWGPKIFEVLNRAYADLYGTTLLTDAQIDFYINSYLGQVDPSFIKLAADGDKLVGFIIAMPNLSRAFQKARGRLFPFGFVHILRDMKRSDVLDFYLAGILPEYRNKGIDAMMTMEMGRTALERGMKFAESNHELEDNTLIQSMWKLYDRRLHRRSRVFTRKL